MRRFRTPTIVAFLTCRFDDETMVKQNVPLILVTGSFAAVLFALAGCNSPTGAASGHKAPPPAKTAASEQPSVRILSWDQTQKQLAEFKGKVVILDIWSTYCEPCVREFPNLVTLQERFGDRVACVSFNTDYSGAKAEPPESFRQPVMNS